MKNNRAHHTLECGTNKWTLLWAQRGALESVLRTERPTPTERTWGRNGRTVVARQDIECHNRNSSIGSGERYIDEHGGIRVHLCAPLSMDAEYTQLHQQRHSRITSQPGFDQHNSSLCKEQSAYSTKRTRTLKHIMHLHMIP
jgi:hypothetical protein